MKTVPLGEVAEWGSGGTPKRSVAEYFGRGTPWLSIADLNDGVVTSAKESLTPAGVANSTAKVVPAGTLFVAMYGSIGKLGIAGTELTMSQAIAFAKPKSDMVEARYLFHYLIAQRPNLQGIGRGGTQMNIGQGDLKAWPIPLPPLPEQRRIAAILDQVDAIRAKRRRAVEELDSLSQSVFHELFGTPTDWPSRWPCGVIGDLARSVNYGTSSKAGAAGNWPILRMGNLTDEGRLDLSDLKYLDVPNGDLPKYTVRRGDMLFNRTNSIEKVGKAAVVRTDMRLAFAGYLVRARFEDSDTAEFVSAYLRSPHGKKVRRRMAKAAVNQANINAAELRQIPIALPPARLRHHFAVAIERIETHRNLLQQALATDDELFASLQSRAFRGEL